MSFLAHLVARAMQRGPLLERRQPSLFEPRAPQRAEAPEPTMAAMPEPAPAAGIAPAGVQGAASDRPAPAYIAPAVLHGATSDRPDDGVVTQPPARGPDPGAAIAAPVLAERAPGGRALSPPTGESLQPPTVAPEPRPTLPRPRGPAEGAAAAQAERAVDEPAGPAFAGHSLQPATDDPEPPQPALLPVASARLLVREPRQPRAAHGDIPPRMEAAHDDDASAAAPDRIDSALKPSRRAETVPVRNRQLGSAHALTAEPRAAPIQARQADAPPTAARAPATPRAEGLPMPEPFRPQPAPERLEPASPHRALLHEPAPLQQALQLAKAAAPHLQGTPAPKTVQVTIGRVEVRAVNGPERAPARPARAATGRLSLADYLRDRSREQR